MSRISQTETMIELINQIQQFRSFISRKDSGKLLKKMLSKVQFFQRNFSLKKWKRTKEKRRESITETDEISRRQRKKGSSLAKNWKGLGRRDATAAPPRKRRCREKVGFWSRRGERACRRRSGDRGTEGSRAVNCNKRESENFRKGKRGRESIAAFDRRLGEIGQGERGMADLSTSSSPSSPLKITFVPVNGNCLRNGKFFLKSPSILFLA